MNNAIVLLSGGLDSTVSLAIIRKYCDKILALTFDYGQKPFKYEKIAAEKIARHYGIEHKIVQLDWLNEVSSSSLNSDSDVPVINEDQLEDKEASAIAAKSVWVPNRNGLFVNIAASYADAMNYDLIVIGANKEEAETFKDNSINFVNTVNMALANSTNYNVKVIAPFIYKTKQEIVEDAIRLNVPLNLIYSCYSGKSHHCGHCESCIRLKRALEQNNRHDMILDLFRNVQ